MLIEELQQGQTVKLLARIGQETIEFETTVKESLPKKHAILTDVVTKNDKVIGFNGKGLAVDLLFQPEDNAPQIFMLVKVVLTKDNEGNLYYMISTISNSKSYNRRNNFRLFIGSEVVVQCGANHSAHDAILKDISISGFAFTIPKEKREFEEKMVVHTVFNDQIEETSKSFSFHLYGVIVRKQEMENGLIVYGCKFNNKVPGLESYIRLMERIRLSNKNGN